MRRVGKWFLANSKGLKKSQLLDTKASPSLTNPAGGAHESYCKLFFTPPIFLYSQPHQAHRRFLPALASSALLCFCVAKKMLREQPNLSEPLEPPKNSRVWFGLFWDGGTITTLSVKEPELVISVKCFSRLQNAPSGAYFFGPFVFSFPFFRIGQALLVSKHEGNGVSG